MFPRIVSKGPCSVSIASILHPAIGDLLDLVNFELAHSMVLLQFLHMVVPYMFGLMAMVFLRQLNLAIVPWHVPILRDAFCAYNLVYLEVNEMAPSLFIMMKGSIKSRKAKLHCADKGAQLKCQFSGANSHYACTLRETPTAPPAYLNCRTIKLCHVED